MLYICAIGFIVAIFLFYGAVGKQTPGGQSLYLGEKELQLFETYQQAAAEQYAIELAATLAAKQASQENFEKEFKEIFGNFLERYNLEGNKYTFTFTPGEGTMTITGITNQVLEFKEQSFIYTLTPNFKITIPHEGEQSPTEESDIFY